MSNGKNIDKKSWLKEVGEKKVLCCIGLIAGFTIGMQLGGIWIAALPFLGFLFGLMVDLNFLRKYGKDESR